MHASTGRISCVAILVMFLVLGCEPRPKHRIVGKWTTTSDFDNSDIVLSFEEDGTFVSTSMIPKSAFSTENELTGTWRYTANGVHVSYERSTTSYGLSSTETFEQDCEFLTQNKLKRGALVYDRVR